MSKNKDDLDEKSDTEKIVKDFRKVFDKHKYSSYHFEHQVNSFVFNRIRQKIRNLIEKKQDFFFRPEQSRPVFSTEELFERYLTPKYDLICIKKSSENDVFFELIKNYYDTLTLEKFLELEKRYQLINSFTQLDNYLFKCFKFVIIKKPDIIDDTKITLKDLKNANGNIEEIINQIAEEKAMSKFDLDLFIDEIIEKKIHNKFYKDYTEIFLFAKNKLSINHVIPEGNINILNFFKQIRNLY